MGLTERENFRRNASLHGHEWIPSRVLISGATWAQEREAMEDVCLRHPLLFPGFRKGEIGFERYKRRPEDKLQIDEWGCGWHAELDGLIGVVEQSPLRDWDAFASWRAPEPKPLSDPEREEFMAARARDAVATVSVPHGFFFMRLHYLRGYEEFMTDVASDDPRLHQLEEILGRYWERHLAPRLALKPDLLDAADDLGTQTRSMIGPEHFRRLIVPYYRRFFEPARRLGAHVFLHSDGYIMDIVDEIISSGVSIVNPQDLVNGIDDIARHLKGRVCVRCDIDRQSVMPFGTPREVRELIREEVMKLGSPAGGLEFIAGVYPPTPARNVDALCSALEEFRTYWAQRP